MSSFDNSISLKTKIKVIFLGDTAVGKSSIISTLRDIPFRYQHQPTVGIDFFSKILIGEKHQYKLQFWDTAGQERFKSIIPSYIRNAHVGIIVYDVGNRNSYNNIENWIDMFRQYSSSQSTAVIMANKIDITHRSVTTEEAMVKAEKYKAEYIQLSAKTKQGIHRFDSILLHILESSKFENEIKSQKGINQQEQQNRLQLSIISKKKKLYQHCCYI